MNVFFKSKIFDYILLLIGPILLVALVLFLYFSSPKHGIVFIPGTIHPIEENLQDGQETNLHRVNVQVFHVNHRIDFYKNMWKAKKLFLDYSVMPVEKEENAEIAFALTTIDVIEAETKKYDFIQTYLHSRYGEEVANSIIEEFYVDDSAIGDSDGFATVLSIIGDYEEKPWLHSKEKIVITGAIDGEGHALPVGSVGLKAIAAKKGDSDVYMLPFSTYNEAQRKYIAKKTSLKVVPVKSIDEAIEWLDANIK